MQERYHGTNIDGHTLEELYVRNKNLNDIIGNFSFPGAIYYLFTGQEPTSSQEELLDRFLASSLSSLKENDPVLEIIPTVINSGATFSQGIIAGLMVDQTKSFEKTIATFDLDAIGLDRDSQIGLYYVGLIPLLMTIAIESIESLDGKRFKLPLVKKDYVEALFTLCTNRTFIDSTERKIFNDVMVSFHGGCGFLPPTVMLPRVASSTRVPMSQAIAAGFTAGGPAHVGACERAMEFFTTLYKHCSGDLETEAIEFLEEQLANKKKISGFGHPMFKVDPRNIRLRAILSEVGMQSDFLKIYDLTAQLLKDKFGIYPNIDGITAAIFLSLGIKPKYGTGLFLCSRTSAMVAHILEQKSKPPFGASSEEIRKWFGPFAVGID